MHSQRIHARPQDAPTNTDVVPERADVIEIPCATPPEDLSGVQRCRHAALLAVQVLDQLPVDAQVVALDIRHWDGEVTVHLRGIETAPGPGHRAGAAPRSRAGPERRQTPPRVVRVRGPLARACGRHHPRREHRGCGERFLVLALVYTGLWCSGRGCGPGPTPRPVRRTPAVMRLPGTGTTSSTPRRAPCTRHWDAPPPRRARHLVDPGEWPADRAPPRAPLLAARFLRVVLTTGTGVAR